MLRDIVHESDAARAQYAPIGDVDDVAAEVLDRIEALWLAIASLRPTFLKRIVLQLAFAGLIADRTIERMVDEQHLEDALPRLERFLCVDANHLAFGDGRGAGGRELGHLLDLDETHAAYAGDRQSGG